MNKSKFTLIEIIFTVTILIILIGIGMATGSKIMRKSAEVQINAELKMIQAAVQAYKTRWGDYPTSAANKVDFAQYLSNVSPHVNYVTDANKPRKRKMYIDFKLSNFNGTNIDNAGYTKSFHGSSIPSVTLMNPYEEAYIYIIVDGLPKVSSP